MCGPITCERRTKRCGFPLLNTPLQCLQTTKNPTCWLGWWKRMLHTTPASVDNTKQASGAEAEGSVWVFGGGTARHWHPGPQQLSRAWGVSSSCLWTALLLLILDMASSSMMMDVQQGDVGSPGAADHSTRFGINSKVREQHIAIGRQAVFTRKENSRVNDAGPNCRCLSGGL